MEIAMVGLGKMGMNMARRLLAGGHRVVAYNRTPQKTEIIVKEGAEGAYSLEEIPEKLSPPRVVWMMLPAGRPVDEHVEIFKDLLSEGDILIDGGNSYYKDDIKRKEILEHRGIHYLDVGVSGGIWGLKEGYCLMIGGDREDYNRIEPLLKTLSTENGYLYCGSIGAGHFVKMVHNGIEYAMMQAYAEGFELLNASAYAQEVNFTDIARLWNHGSVIRSWLLELLEKAFTEDPRLDSILGYVEDSGEGRWTLKEAIEMGVPADAIAISLFRRFRSRQEASFSEKILAALRAQFGGHKVLKRSGED